MKPRNKFETEVFELNKNIAKLSKEDTDYALSTFKNYVYTTKKQQTCLSCNDQWENNISPDSLIHKLSTVTCHCCGSELESFPDKRRSNKESHHILKIDTYKNYQLVRIFYAEKFVKAGKKQEFFITEVIRHWIREDGKFVLFAIEHNPMNYYSIGMAWRFGSKMSVKADMDKYYIYNKFIFPNKKILKNIKRNGFKKQFHSLHPSWLFQLILTNNKAETFLKTKQYPLLNFFGSSTRDEMINHYWNSIKICIRNNYTIDKPSDWFDHLQLLEHFGKDIHNPKYICPADFEHEHQKLIAKKRKEYELKRIKELQEKINTENRVYRKRIKNFLGIKLTDGELQIGVIPSVKDFVIEGNTHNHCVFTNEYFKKDDSLIMSAKVGKQRIETVEFSLRNMKVLQSRGSNNKTTKYHKRIINLIESNKRLFKKAM